MFNEPENPNDASQNPILSSQRIVGLVPTRQPSAAQRKVILELGLRYRPQSPGQLEGHQAKVVALLADTIDVPAHLLDDAAKEWARTSRWMPTAADLIQLAQRLVPIAQPVGQGTAATLADRYNERLARENPKRADEVVWLQTDAGPVMRWRSELRAA